MNEKEFDTLVRATSLAYNKCVSLLQAGNLDAHTRADILYSELFDKVIHTIMEDKALGMRLEYLETIYDIGG